ncbi:hypothetical protein PMSD_23240 [Paenibacillus macquariensis subsp. defensor]|nr:hypothetical protein PMSD_23240 [Paenibacillus macquariensis subsp. defensor]
MVRGTDYLIKENHIFVSSNKLVSLMPYEPLPGKALTWDPILKMLLIFEESINPYHEVNKDKKYRFSIIAGKDYFYIGENKVSLSSPAILLKGSMYIPLRDVREGYGMKVNWNQKTKELTIKK